MQQVALHPIVSPCTCNSGGEKLDGLGDGEGHDGRNQGVILQYREIGGGIR